MEICVYIERKTMFGNKEQLLCCLLKGNNLPSIKTVQNTCKGIEECK